jgi:hypothetical protein
MILCMPGRICYNKLMEPKQFWETYMHGIRPADFMSAFDVNDPVLCVSEYVRQRPSFYGIVRRRTWTETFVPGEPQFSRESVRSALITYLEETRSDWEIVAEEARKIRIEDQRRRIEEAARAREAAARRQAEAAAIAQAMAELHAAESATQETAVEDAPVVETEQTSESDVAPMDPDELPPVSPLEPTSETTG